MVTGLEKKEEGVVPTSARLHLFPPSAYASLIKFVLFPASSIVLIGRERLLMGFALGLAFDAALLWYLGLLSCFGCSVEVHTEHISMVRGKRFIWQCRWSDIQNIEPIGHQVVITLRDGSTRKFSVQNLSPKSRATLKTYIPGHLNPEAPVQLASFQIPRQISRSMLYVGGVTALLASIGFIWTISDLKASAWVFTFGSIAILSAAVAMVGLLEAFKEKEPVALPEGAAVPRLSSHLLAATDSPMRSRACVWMPLPPSEADATAETQLMKVINITSFVLLCSTMPFLLHGTSKWLLASAALIVAVAARWATSIRKRRLDPEGWKVITLDDQIEAIREGTVYPVKADRCLGKSHLHVQFEGKDRLLFSREFFLHESAVD